MLMLISVKVKLVNYEFMKIVIFKIFHAIFVKYIN